MKKRNFRTITALLLVFMMLFGSMTLASAEGTTETPETTTGSYDEGYDDGYNSGYNDGYNDGNNDGYNNGYDSGYNDAKENKDFFDIIRERIYDLQERLDDFYDSIESHFKKTFNIGGIDKKYLPDEDQVTIFDDNDYSDDQLCYDFNDLMNSLYYPGEPMKYTKTEKVGVEITECPGGKLTAALLNPIIENYLVDEVTEYKTSGGYAPGMQAVRLYPYGVKSAKLTENADGTKAYEFVLIEEATYYDGEMDIPIDPYTGEVDYYGSNYHYQAADILFVDSFNGDPFEITHATVLYPGATIKATTDTEGRVVTLDINMPVKGSGRVKLGLIGADIELAGYRNEGFVITYPGLDLDIDIEIPEDQVTLEGNEEAAALCAEFQKLINDFSWGVPDNAVIKRTDTLDIEATDLPGAVASIVNPIIDKFTGTNTNEETVIKGDYPYLIDSIRIYPEALVTAEKTANEDGTTDYKFVLAKEQAHYDGYETYGVKYVDGTWQATEIYHGYIGKGVYIENADLGPVTITSADITFAGATITAKTDAQGRLINYEIINPVVGSGTGKVAYISATVTIEGIETETIEIIYN